MKMLVLFAALAFSLSVVSSQWKIPATAPLLTKWSKQVSPKNVLPEYPRPQLVRTDWMNLNGLWQYAEAAASEQPPVGKELDGKILVPYPIESALSGVMKHLDRFWYRTTVKIPQKWAGRNIMLHFGAVDWEATIYVNGKQVGQHRGGYDPFSFDVTSALTPEGMQEIIVGVYDPTDQGDQPRGKQVLNPRGIWYTPVTGIWQTVWLEPVAVDHITELISVPDVDGKKLNLKVLSGGDVTAQSARITVIENGKAIVETEGKPGDDIPIPLRSPKLWSPAKPFLYDLKVELRKDGKILDVVKSYFGMRKVELGNDSKGINRMLLNGEFVFQLGPLDQGFWPDGIYTAPTDQALKYDIEMTKKLGFNMARKHVKIEPDRWYYWADKLGLLVWQDMPSANNKTDDSKKQFEAELQRLIETRRNHPSIILWVVFNEGWGQYDTERLTAWVKDADPSRLVINASGWTDKNVGDVMDVHNYPAPIAPKAEPNRAIVLGEFGGLGLAVEGHTWKKENWGYRGMIDAEQLTTQYEKYLKKVYELKDSPGLSAAVYTQTTDVEIECNGLLTYDRAIVKPNLARVAAANKGDFSLMPPEPIVKMVIPTSEQEARTWRYTLEKPGDAWMKPEFDDTKWMVGQAGFGKKETPGGVIRTEWTTNDIWLRTEFELPDKRYTNLQFRIHHDDDAEVYVNGVLAGAYGRYTVEYEETPMLPAGRKAFRPGKNVIAVHCLQKRGGQYIDVGLVDVIPTRRSK
jgi:hypothetical protein